MHHPFVKANNLFRTEDSQQSGTVFERLSLVLSAEIEFSQLHSSVRLTMFVPSTI